MKKWLMWGIFLAVLLCTGIFTFAYNTVRVPLIEGYEQAEVYVIEHTILDTVDTVSYYHGTKPFYVIYGKKDGEDVIVWIEQNFEKVVSRMASEGITVEEALSKAKENVDIISIEKVRLGFERGLPVYEIVFIDKDNRQGYYYLTFDDGTFMKRYSLRRNDI